MARKRHFGTIWKEGNSYRIAWKMDRGDGTAKRYRRTIGSKRGTAARRLSQIEAALAKDKSPAQVLHEVFGDPLPAGDTFRDWADRYKARPLDEGHQRDPEQVQKENWRIDHVCKAPWAKLPIEGIQRKQIKAWHERRAREASGPTANRGLGVASVVFKYAIEFEAIHDNPCEGVRRYSEIGRERDCYLTADEARSLVSSCSDWFRPFVVLALHTGMRRGELLELQWDQVDFLRERIQARRRQTRTKKKRLVGMNSYARDALLEVRERAGAESAKREDRVFPWSSWRARVEWDATLSRCRGIPEDKKDEVVFHTLRHTFASLMVQDGTSLEELMKILGHLHFVTVQRYAKFKPDVGVAPVRRLERVLGDGEAGGEGAGAIVSG
ncbi:MAG: tyrosine-type recombinase/integrase [Planctomycetota bacterium]